MRRLASMLTLLVIGPISQLAARPVLAFPPLPSSFYGKVKVNGVKLPDGTLVQASMYIGIVIAGFILFVLLFTVLWLVIVHNQKVK